MKNVTDMMTVEEKAGIVQGTACMYTRPVKRLGVPALSMSDGPHGVRKLIDNKTDVDDCERATAFPPESTVANSWNVENTLKIGEAIGEECLYYGVGLILGLSLIHI